jgi:hypothetical protein
MTAIRRQHTKVAELQDPHRAGQARTDIAYNYHDNLYRASPNGLRRRTVVY